MRYVKSGMLAGFISGILFLFFLWIPELFEDPVTDGYNPTATTTLSQIGQVASMVLFVGGSGTFIGMFIGSLVGLAMLKEQSLRFLPIFFTTVAGIIITSCTTLGLWDSLHDADQPPIFFWLRMTSGGIGSLIGWVFFRWYSKRLQLYQESDEKYADVGLDE